MDSYAKRPIISEPWLAPTKAINNATCIFSNWNVRIERRKKSENTIIVKTFP
jgi:hypothetical protein